MKPVALWLLVGEEWVKLGVVNFKGAVESGGGWRVTDVSEDDEDEIMDIESPVTSLEAMAATHHEIYSAYVEAGFSRREALELVKIGIISAMNEDE